MGSDGRFQKGVHYSPETEFKKGVWLGPKSPVYNHGLSYFERDKRWFIFCRDKTKVPFARAMIEGYLGRVLGRNEIVHHKNHCPTDDRLENLGVLTRAEHLLTHDPLEKRHGKETIFNKKTGESKRTGEEHAQSR